MTWQSGWWKKQLDSSNLFHPWIKIYGWIQHYTHKKTHLTLMITKEIKKIIAFELWIFQRQNHFHFITETCNMENSQNKSKPFRSHVKMRRKNVFHNMSYDQYGCNTKEKIIIKEMINKYFVKLKIKDFLFLKKIFF